MIRRYLSIIFILVLVILPANISCRRNQYKANISSVSVNLQVLRIEKDLFLTDPGKISEKIPLLKEKYGSFLQLFSYVISAGEVEDSTFNYLLTEFCTDKLNNEIFSLTTELFPDVSEIEEKLEDAFRHYIYYFPSKNIPSVYTCITGFNNSIITGDSILGIALDMYLGDGCKYYSQLGIYSYISARMTPLYIIPDCIYGWGASEWNYAVMDYSPRNVISKMIHEGKLKYFQKCLLPDIPDELIFGFTNDQMKFCRNNEDRMWQYLIENDLLFKTNRLTVRKLTGEAPFTSYFTNESPGRAAVWTGFRIIESFMKANPAVSLFDLMNNTDIQGIVEKAKYSPE